MKASKVLAFFCGLIPMTLIQYFYWIWLISEIIDRTQMLEKYLFVIVIVVLAYCLYERFFVFSAITANSSFRDRVPLAVFWVLECVIGAVISTEKLYEYKLQHDYSSPLIGVKTCPNFALVLIWCFVLCRIFLYKKKNRNDANELSQE